MEWTTDFGCGCQFSTLKRYGCPGSGKPIGLSKRLRKIANSMKMLSSFSQASLRMPCLAFVSGKPVIVLSEGVRSGAGNADCCHRNGMQAVLELSGGLDFITYRDFALRLITLWVDPELVAVRFGFFRGRISRLLSARHAPDVARQTGWRQEGLELTGVHGNVKPVLEIANFGKRFHID